MEQHSVHKYLCIVKGKSHNITKLKMP